MPESKNQTTRNSLPFSSWHLNLKQIEFILLCLMIAVLPTFEAPKNIFWALYFIAATTRLIVQRHSLTWRWPDAFFGIWIASALASTIGAGMPGHHEWGGFKDLFIYSSTAWLIYKSNYTQKQLTNLLLLAVISVIPPLLWGAWLHLGPTHKLFLELKSVGHVNHSAIYLTIVYGICLSMTIGQWLYSSFAKNLLFTTITALLFLSIMIGQSRAALGIAIPLSILIFFLLTDSKKIKLIGFSLLGLCLASLILINPIIVQKHKNNVADNNTLSNRAQVWNVSLEAARWHPILGLGMNNWKFITPEAIKGSVEKRGTPYQPDNYFFPNHSHNLYLTILVERGMIGLSVLIITLLAWGIHLIKTYQPCKRQGQLMIWGSALSAYIIVIGIGTVNTTIHHEHGLLTALCLGILLAATHPKITKTVSN
jgi:O-antigen ligase